jgi:N-acetylglucosaminyldiphosphoundecaprenol N-acetyl-beta-D-mannosaminyltransferase
VTEPPKELILGYEVETLSVYECVESIVSAMAAGERFKWLACLNPHSFVVAIDDDEFARALKAADWLIPDGVGIVLASKVLGGRIKQRVSGPEVFVALLDRLNRSGGARVFFMGSAPDTLDLIQRRVQREYPNITVAGTHSPPYKVVYSSDEVDAMISAINAADVDVLWVGLTAPKQEKWIQANGDRLNVKFIGAVGATFDYFAGRVKPTPRALQRVGLQALHRLLQNPRRLWRRTFVSTPIFVYLVIRARAASAGRKQWAKES